MLTPCKKEEMWFDKEINGTNVPCIQVFGKMNPVRTWTFGLVYAFMMACLLILHVTVVCRKGEKGIGRKEEKREKKGKVKI